MLAPCQKEAPVNRDDASTQVLALCAPGLTHARRPWRVAISGLPGSGKSTLAQAVARRARAAGWHAVSLSLDDFYLSRRARLDLARTRHPLLATRGVPGTHDLPLLLQTLKDLARADAAHPVTIPRFDKARDTRRPPSRWSRVAQTPRLVIVEGWCLGITPQAETALALPVNTLERDEDADGRWRHFVNRRVGDYLPLWTEADTRILIRTPNWPTVVHQRDAAEDVRRRRHAPQAMDTARLRRFLQHYERLGRHALSVPPAHADLVLPARTSTDQK